MKIKVLKKDIIKATKIFKTVQKMRPDNWSDVWAKKYAAKSCPIAQALRRRFKKKIRVLDASMFINKKEYYVSDDIFDFMFDFDKDRAVRPFSFELVERKI